MAIIANLASALMMLLPIMHNAKGTDKIIGLKNSVAGCMIALAQSKTFRLKEFPKGKN
jgi:hypothetical protein